MVLKLNHVNEAFLNQAGKNIITFTTIGNIELGQNVIIVFNDREYLFQVSNIYAEINDEELFHVKAEEIGYYNKIEDLSNLRKIIGLEVVFVDDKDYI